jgi:GNAT superfamily N-acetyltransferase
MMTESITIRQATLADKPRIFAFIRQAYQGRWEYKIPERWEWEFEHNPFRNPDSLPIWIAVENESGQVVGQSCALVEPLFLGGNWFQVGWGVDFYVLPGFRGLGIGTRLQAANNEGNEIFMSLSMADSAKRIKASLGLEPLSPVPVFTRIVNHDPESTLETLTSRLSPAPKGTLRALQLHRLVASWLTRREKRRDRNFPSQVNSSLKLEKVDLFGDEINTLWERISPHFYALIRRDADYLNWKYARQPHMEHMRFLARENGQVCGYLVLRRARPPERNAGIIVDLFASPEDENTIQTMLNHAVNIFRQANVTYVTAASSVPTYQKYLLGFGFKITKQVTPMIRANTPVKTEGWLLGKGDHDWDQYPLA